MVINSSMRPKRCATLVRWNAEAHQPCVAGALGEPIAIVGMSCRFPGTSIPGKGWQMVADARGRDVRISTVGGIWPGCWIPDVRHKSYAPHWELVVGVADSIAFFGISLSEALAMDPSIEMLLEIFRWSGPVSSDRIAQRTFRVFAGLIVGGAECWPRRSGAAG